MKTKIKLLISSSILGISLFSLINLNRNNVKESKGYNSSSLPSTINLNDSTDSEIRSYYSSLNSLAANQRTGTNLLKNLKPILKNNQKYYSYDSGDSVWKLYEIVDRDWEKSPASDLAGYNSSTNIITGYTYNSSDPYVRALYINRDADNKTTAWSDHQQTQWGINREHVWPKSQGFNTKTDGATGGARGDPMHLWAGNGYVNNMHSNLPYGNVDKTQSYTTVPVGYTNLTGNYKGVSSTKGSGTVFEPQDSDKGDIARAVFYMAARYNYLSGSDSDGIDSNNPNLELVDYLSSTSPSYTSSTTTTGKLGVLSDLLEWNRIDPPDEFEIHRNNLLYKNYTNNRNPFIDFPEWAEYVWGNQAGSVSANPSSDVINQDLNEDVASISINKSTDSIYVGDETTLSATSSDSSTISWSSSNTSIATVSANTSASGEEITVTGVSIGKATITASATIGGNTLTKTCVVTVKEEETPSATSGSISASEGAFEGWTASGLGSKYADGSAKFDSTGDYVQNTSLFTGTVSSKMTSLTVTINGKINGTDSASNSYKIEALNSEGTVIDSATYTGLIGTSYNNKVFSLNTSLNGCVGFRVKYNSKDTGNWGIKSIAWSAEYQTITSITATVDKTFYVGEYIESSDITVTGDDDSNITDFYFEDDGYLFTYEDSNSGASLKEKEFIISYESFETTLTVNVGRKATTTSNVSDSLDRAYTGISGTTYKSWSGKAGSSSTAVYAGQSAGGNSAIQLRSDNSNSGIISTTSGGKLVSVSVTWNTNTGNGRALNVYGDNSAYTNPTDLYNNSTQGTLLGTIVKGTSISLNITGNYTFIGVRSNSGALYLDELVITYSAFTKTAVNVANYIMYEDTANQCNTKYSVAKGYFNGLSVAERSSFMTSNDYVISTARNRLEAWARNKGEEIIHINGDYSFSSGAHSFSVVNDDNQLVIIITSISTISLLGLLFFLKKKKN